MNMVREMLVRFLFWALGEPLLDKLTEQFVDDPRLARAVARELDPEEVADWVEIDPADVAEELDLEALAKHVDLSELADEIDLEEVVDEIEPRAVAERVDLDELAEALNRMRCWNRAERRRVAGGH